MDIATIIDDTLKQSKAGKIHFGQVIATLMQAGVESYQVDYRANRATYYLPDSETYTFELSTESSKIAKEFSEMQIKAAILGAQSGQVMYPEFIELSQSAGCIGYIVWISGKHVSYYGRCGEVHIEPFPN